MFVPDLLAFLLVLRGAHAGTILVAFFARHELAAVDTILLSHLIAVLLLILQPVAILGSVTDLVRGKQRPGRQRQCASQYRHRNGTFQHDDLLFVWLCGSTTMRRPERTCKHIIVAADRQSCIG